MSQDDYNHGYNDGVEWATKELADKGWKEAAIAWNVCASIHREYAKRKDALFSTRQADFVKHIADARAKLGIVPDQLRKREAARAAVDAYHEYIRQHS